MIVKLLKIISKILEKAEIIKVIKRIFSFLFNKISTKIKLKNKTKKGL